MYKKIFKTIKAYDTIVLARHISPDPDAIASQIALRDSIKMTFPNKKVYAIGAGVSKFKYLGDLDKVDVSKLEHALLIVLDVPNFARVDGIGGLSYDAILKIDHHPRMDITGDVDWTDDTKSSTCEMLINLIMNTKLGMDKSIAENLFVGLVFDNDRFLLSNTTPDTFQTVAELLKAVPINISPLYDNLYTRNYKELKFYGYIINNLEITKNGFGHVLIEEETLKKYEVDPATPSHFINDLYFINELVCWCFITEDKRNGLYKVNIRSRGPIINEIAEKYSGGGHKFASGCRIQTKKEITELLNSLDDTCEKYNNTEND